MTSHRILCRRDVFNSASERRRVHLVSQAWWLQARLTSAPSASVEPLVDHRMRDRLRLLAVATHDFARHFNFTGVNGHEPFIAFGPGADRVPNASVFHETNNAPKSKPEQFENCAMR